MHRRLTEHGKYDMQNNQLQAKSHVELEDISIVEFDLNLHWHLKP